jgi:hypothetical protein
MGTPFANEQQLLARVERLEQLLQLLQGGSAPGTSFAGPIVPNEAAMRALVGILDGEQVFVLSHRSIWTKRNGVAGTQGVPPLAPHEVDPADDLTGVFCRTNYSDPALRTGINDIFIDPANVNANDENSGLTALLPLKTGQELFRRWGWGTPVLIGPNFATSPDGFLNVNIQSDLVSPDQLDVNVIIASNGSLRFRGGTPTTIRTSTLTGASTAMNRAAPLGGTRLRLVDAATVTWVPDMVANRRGRITTGAQAGATFQPQTNVGVGGAVDCSGAQTTNEPGFSTTPVTVTPAAGSTYVIESLVQCNFGIFHVAQQINPAFGGFSCFVNFIDLNFPNTPNQNWGPIADSGFFDSPFLNFYQCTFDRNLDLTMAGSYNTVACYWFDTQVHNFSSYAPGNINGGGMNSNVGLSGVLWSCKNQDTIIDFDFVANKSIVLMSADAAVKNFASWNARTLAGVNAAGHGVLVGVIGFAGLCGRTRFTGTLWGNGNGGAGLLIGAACKGAGAPQNITGTQGDLKLANNPSVGGNNVYWQAASGLYVGATGAAGVASNATWALLTAAKAAPGYGGSVHFPDQDASFVALETTA